VNPEEAFKIHEDTQTYNTIGIHWGTFKLSNEVGNSSDTRALDSWIC
jgi:hypothetical protein